MDVGIIIAADRELNAVKDLIDNIVQEKYYDLIFYKGQIQKKNVVLVKCGIGKVNAARTTQILTDKFLPKIIINIGSAGGLNTELNVKDIVIGEKLVQYDFDISALGESEKGEIQGVGKYIESDKELLEMCKKVLLNMPQRDFNVKVGIIASADYFCADTKKSSEIRKEFNAECVEMEGAAVAQVCFLNKVPFLVVRGISDTQNGNNKIDYYQYCSEASKQVANMLDELLKNKL